MSPRRLILLLIAVVTVGLVGAYVGLRLREPPAPPPSAIGGAFQMSDQNGRAVDADLLKDKWSLVFFGFTYCPDVCPTTLQAMNAARQQLGGKAKDVQIVFVSVDPGRDDPEQMEAYLEGQGLSGVVGLTGTPEQVETFARNYKVFYRKVGEGEGYTVDHTTVAYLMDPKGRFVKPLAYGMSPEQMAGQIRQAM
ncbi:MAG TPA: SCO family protein [Caulobacteraceae bacterium]|nr:SCO family protein [Caulobacteraceae bacterium]